MTEEAFTRFLVRDWFPIGEATVAEWMDIDSEDKTISIRFKPKFGFKPKDYEERTIAISDNTPALIFPSPETRTLDRHLDRIVNSLIDKANQAGYFVKKPKKPCHVFCVLYATRRHQHGSRRMRPSS